MRPAPRSHAAQGAIAAMSLGAIAALDGACTVLFPLDGYDTPTGSSGSSSSSGSGGSSGTTTSDSTSSDTTSSSETTSSTTSTTNPCMGAADGTQWDGSNYFARCCGGKPTFLDKDLSNCGVCGVQCFAGQTCFQQDPAGHPHAVYCRDCKVKGCPNGLCCAQTINVDVGVCAPSKCSSSDCVQSLCPTGSTCKQVVGSSNDYCEY